MNGGQRPRPSEAPAQDESGAEAAAIALAALDALGEAVLVRDALGQVTHVNQIFLDLFGGARADWVGRAFAPSAGEARSQDGERVFETLMRTRSGALWVEWTERPLAEGAGAVAIGRDVTGRREAARDHEAAQRAKSRFFASVTHELRTPLAGALGMARLLAGTPLQPDQASYVDALTGSASHALAMIDDILDISRLEAGRLELRPAPLDLPALVRETVELAAPRAHEKGLEIAVVLAEDAPQRVEADAARLKQILFNLIGNAVKFTESGGVRVDVGARKDATGADQVGISVADTGPGIAAEDQQSLFEHFERGAAETQNHEGAGLGLAMVRRLVEAMDGEISLDSAPGHGAAFRIILPLPVLSRIETDAFRGRRFAVAAPGAVLRDALSDQIEALGGEVLRIDEKSRIAAASGRELLIDAAWRDALAAAGAAHSWLLVNPEEKAERVADMPAEADGWLVKPVRRESLIALARGEREETDAPAETRDAAGEDASRLAGLRVLLAEDDPVNAVIARKMLERFGAEAVWVGDGAQALEALTGTTGGEGEFDAALIDQRMPEMDGPDVARAARMAGVATPLVALTANATEADRSLCLDAGMDEFLTKPVDPDVLVVTLEALCRGRKQASIA
jgi:signal transduction histidine kinase/CheY-like chemotaxis protein